jgi:hypothetical protein
MNLKYEYISLGSNCSITYQLNKFGLRTQSYPFDWTKITLNQLISVLENKFHNYVESIEFRNLSESHPLLIDEQLNKPEETTSIVLTNYYSIQFAHEISKKYEIEDFKIKLNQRINRFNGLEKSFQEVNFIRIELKPLNTNWSKQIMKLYSLLGYYCENFKLILIVCSDYKFEFPPNIIVHRFEKFEPNWKMESIDWNEIFY